MRKNILICPLNWGLGHATRCVPIVRGLLELGYNVIIAADKAPLSFLQKEFPNLEFIRLPGFEPTYSKGNSQVFKLLKSIPGAIIDFKREHKALEKIVKDHNIDIVISDNRFGCWSKNVYSVYITHQLNIQVPRFFRWTQPIINKIHHSYIKHYNELWVPDISSSPSLAGELSHNSKVKVKTRYIGFLSRFTSEAQEREKEIDYLVILSGPEPQRTILENIVIRQSCDVEGKIVVLRAKPNDTEFPCNLPQNVTFYNHADDAFFVELVEKSKNIICRGGYSSLMDLICLNRNAFLIPTPGQTEQEYLADYLSRKGLFNSCKQKDFTFDKVIIPETKIKDCFAIKSQNEIKIFLEEWIINKNNIFAKN